MNSLKSLPFLTKTGNFLNRSKRINYQIQEWPLKFDEFVVENLSKIINLLPRPTPKTKKNIVLQHTNYNNYQFMFFPTSKITLKILTKNGRFPWSNVNFFMAKNRVKTKTEDVLQGRSNGRMVNICQFEKFVHLSPNDAISHGEVMAE